MPYKLRSWPEPASNRIRAFKAKYKHWLLFLV